ncbi:uncharacterized protein VTP21DRAFT_7224 [Calcarisporiella thermophila]|uniref:uncharacterized protein n=1 Tax=Calcarisporiella thermophila TaxID=911321 RepID=UPI003743ABC9
MALHPPPYTHSHHDEEEDEDDEEFASASEGEELPDEDEQDYEHQQQGMSATSAREKHGVAESTAPVEETLNREPETGSQVEIRADNANADRETLSTVESNATRSKCTVDSPEVAAAAEPKNADIASDAIIMETAQADNSPALDTMKGSSDSGTDANLGDVAGQHEDLEVNITKRSELKAIPESTTTFANSTSELAEPVATSVIDDNIPTEEIENLVIDDWEWGEEKEQQDQEGSLPEDEKEIDDGEDWGTWDTFDTPAQPARKEQKLEQEWGAWDDFGDENTTARTDKDSARWESSWGSWLSSAVKTVENVVHNADVDSIYAKAQTLGKEFRNVTSVGIDRVYGSLDPDWQGDSESAPNVNASTSHQELGESNREKSSQVSSPTLGEKDFRVKEKVETTAEALLSTIDKTFDFASNALGSAVFGGYRNLQQANLGKRLDELRQNVDTTPVQQVSENVVSQSLGALELLGKRAMEVVNEQRNRVRKDKDIDPTQKKQMLDQLDQDAANLRSTALSPIQMQTMIVENIGPSLKELFEKSRGSEHIQRLNLLNQEAANKFSQLASEQPELVDRAKESFQQLDDIFLEQSIIELMQENDESVMGDSKSFQELVSLLEKLGVKASTQLRQMRSITRRLGTTSENTVANLKQSWDEFSVVGDITEQKISVRKFLGDHLANTYSVGLKTTVSFTERSCEQMLRLAENFLMRIAEDQMHGENSLPKEEVVNSAQRLVELVGRILTECRFIAITHIDALEASVKHARREFEAPFDSFDWDAVDLEAKLLEERLHSESRRAMQYTLEAARSLLEILRLRELVNLRS